ncbi:uncharacterized protein LOC123259557 [Cotesia glomerata]|uniref:Uncharacterized protein n=1 Tax=Cotesia glomerata TaxID=32391 RepID=A0AAV7I3C5_COTGL|nr:uncharacterized protein LOC123259557 [Cotesia glomerata]KAH0541045.1 hypothetical protein KQX54_020860 [Cotesia glomerata]
MDNIRQSSTVSRVINNFSENPPDILDCYKDKWSWSKVKMSIGKFFDKFKSVNEYDQVKPRNDNKSQTSPSSIEKMMIQERLARDYQRELRRLCERNFCQIKMQDPCEICCCTPCEMPKEDPCHGVSRKTHPPKCQCARAVVKEKGCCDACENALKRI